MGRAVWSIIFTDPPTHVTVLMEKKSAIEFPLDVDGSKGFPGTGWLNLQIASPGHRERNPPMDEVVGAEDQTPPFQAVFQDGAAVVGDRGRFGELELSGYGMREGKGLVLRDYESLYLLYAKKLQLKDGSGQEIDFEKLADMTQKAARDAWTKFMIYRDLRSRGYVVREGFGFGTDLRVYERGDYPKKPAKYVVFALDEGIEKPMGELQKSVGEMSKMGKEAIIAVIERRGEVIYYKVSKARF